MKENIPFLHNELKICPSWIYVIPYDCWTPPVPAPELTQEETEQNYEYKWDEDLYQENGAMGNPHGWVLIKKSV